MPGRLLIGVELTQHCDQRCKHCLRNDLATVVEFEPALFRDIVAQAGPLFGEPHFAFTGGEVTLHRRFFDFPEILRDAGHTFHFVTNGNSYPRIRRRLQDFRGTLTGVSISLDGGTEAVHDRIRGRGSFRRTAMAIALAARDEWQVTVQMIVNRVNRHEMRTVAELCQELGVRMLMYGHTQPIERASYNKIAFEPAEWIEIDREIEQLQEDYDLPIAKTSGHYDPAPIAHCRTLRHESFNIDCHGRLTFCCQLSGVAGHPGDEDVIADLREVPLVEALDRHLAMAHDVTRARLRYVAAANGDPYRNFHCFFCMRRFGKLAHLGIRGIADEEDPNRRKLRVVR